MYMTDRLTLDAPRFDSAGNMVASVLAARTGIQDYAGYEVGRPEMRIVRVLRPEAEVFAADSLRSFAGAPVTIDHPPESVTTDNWKTYAVGETDGEVVRDGEAVRVPFLLRDAAAIREVEAGKREISMGYACDLAFEPGEHEGRPYDAVQRNIRINHLAIVDHARGGSALRIGDGAGGAGDGAGGEGGTNRTILFDGRPIDVTPEGAAAIEALLARLDDADGKAGALEALIAALTADRDTRDATIATLERRVRDAAPTPARLRDLARGYADAVASARALGVAVGEDDTVEAIMAAVVSARLGDEARGWSEAQIAASFAALSAGLRDAAPDPLRRAISGGLTNLGDARAARDAALARRRAYNATAYCGIDAAQGA